MAQVTVELGRLLERTNFKLFDFDYQFDDPEFKKQLEEHIIDYFYDYEIGFETPDMFKRKFKAKWKRIIPYYNKLYNTTLLEYNPLINYKIDEALEQLAQSRNTQDSTTDNIVDYTSNRTADTTTKGKTFTDSNTRASDYPQQPIAGGDFLSGESNTITDVNSEDEGKTVDRTTDKTTTSTTGNITSEGENETSYSKTIEGLTGRTYQELIKQERENILKIPPMVIEEMKSCFILVY